MIRHLLKLVWNRKRSTALLMLEIAISFLVVFTVAAFALRAADNWRQPLGFEWKNVWVAEIDTSVTTDDSWSDEEVQSTRQLIAEAQRLPGVEAVAGAFVVPYEFSSSNGDVSRGTRRTMTVVDEVTDDFARTMSLNLVAGRFFSREDDGAALPPVVINRRLAGELFGAESPVGQRIERGEREYRVVGVVDDFRQFGELTSSDNYLFHRSVLRAMGCASLPPDQLMQARMRGECQRPPRRLALRMAPGTPTAHEQLIASRLGAVVPGWSITVRPLSTLRTSRFQFDMAPLVVGGIVGLFLLLMVALGLLGVLWQNVTRRTRELGLRRAAGASQAAVHRQILAELALVTALAVLPALLLVVQLPLLSLIGLPGPVFGAAVGTALLVVFSLALLCGLYPSWIATRRAPAEALRWE